VLQAITLTSATGGATLGARASATLTILDDESTLAVSAVYRRGAEDAWAKP